MDQTSTSAPSSRVIIFDTTLRDGEQSPGATMSLKEKLSVASLLDGMGVDVIEAGFAASSPGDAQCIEAVSKAVSRATICSLARAIKADIEAAARSLEKAAKPRIHTFVSTSDIHIEYQMRKTKDQILEIIDETVRFAKNLCDDIEWSAMDATRSDVAFLSKAVDTAIRAGARTINIPDTVGYTMPDEYKALMATLSSRFPQAIFSVHCHNDLGLATANSLAGVRGGARQIECTINGIGERAGNAALEEVVMALKTRQDHFGCDTGIDTRQIYPASRFVSSVTGFLIQKNKAIVGANAFAHESGIHQDGMLKNRNTYEIMSPESVGITQSSLVLGKHSGRAALKSKIAEWRLVVTDEEFEKIFESFKALCDRKKNVTEEDFLTIINDQNHAEHQTFATLTSFRTEQLGAGSYSANVTITVNGGTQETTAHGDGPLDAIFRAVNDATGCAPELNSFEAHSVSQGADAQAEAVIILKDGEKLLTGHARDTDTIMASARAYVSAINKILAQKVS